MRTSAFDFELPQALVALRPAVPRDAARMLVVRENGTREHAFVRDLPDYLSANDVLVFNDTKVIHARLRGVRAGRGTTEPKLEILLHRRLSPDSFSAFARPARKLADGDRLKLGRSLDACVLGRGAAGEITLRFDVAGAPLDEAISREGEVPLPPYIAGKRPADARDGTDYQTIFAAHEGSIAAPTAGLHFTPRLLSRLAEKGIEREALTLHVGAGTFLPVGAEETSAHKMHAEFAELGAIQASKVNDARKRGGRIVAVGTTSLRTLESAADSSGALHAFRGETDLFIVPGYCFKTAEILLTNFHLPRSTLFMLVSAFAGLERMREAYAEAIARQYRFYSYGDACLLFRPE